MTNGFPMLSIRRAPADYDTQAYWFWFWFNIFIMGGIFWLYQTHGLFIICAPDTDVTEDSHSDSLRTAGHKKNIW